MDYQPKTQVTVRGNKVVPCPYCHGRPPRAYIVTSNRGKEYLVFAGSVEHKNAAMFGYKMRALYE